MIFELEADWRAVGGSKWLGASGRTTTAAIGLCVDPQVATSTAPFIGKSMVKFIVCASVSVSRPMSARGFDPN